MNEMTRKFLKSCLRFIPDKVYISLQYKYHLGYFPNLKKPKTFNEKLQWLKLYDRKPEYSIMVDKYEVKQFVGKIIGEKYITPNYGVWNTFDEIDFDKLPNSFVLKCTHDSGSVIICKNKNDFDYDYAKSLLNRCLKNNFYWSGREWAYKNVKPRIIAEKYMTESSNTGLQKKCEESGLKDYKFFCFNGEAKFLYISKGLDKHETAEISFYDLNGKEMYFHRNDYKPYHGAVMPDNFMEMIDIANLLAKKVPCPFIRVDLYSINSCIYFSELTFCPCLGVTPFEPNSADFDLGNMLDLNLDK